MSNQTYELTLNEESEVLISPVDFEIIKVQILDCRSNEPVINAHLKKLVINGEVTIENNFEQADVRIDTGDKIKDTQTALNRLGYDLGTVDGDFGPKSREQYNMFWGDRAPGQVAEITEGTPPDEMQDYIIAEYNSHWGTDDSGILNVRIPVNALDESTLDIDFGFWDFPVVLERIKNDSRMEIPKRNPILREEDTAGNGTGFNIVWGGDQSTEWGADFGWRIESDVDGSFFKVSVQLIIKDNASDFTEIDENLMSVFYNKENPKYHFNLFAMQWCQPVWDGIEDNATGQAGAISENSYIQDADYANLNMHIVTRYAGGALSNNGKTYGTTRHLNANPTRYEAVDVFIHESGSTKLFAVHGGKAIGHNNPLSAAGRYIDLKTYNSKQVERAIRYLHLHQLDSFLTGSEVLPNLSSSTISNKYIMAGTILGTGGTTGFPTAGNGEISAMPSNNYQPPSYAPNHVHMDDQGPGTHGDGLLSNYEEVDIYNRKCLPLPELTPFMLPCSCIVTLQSMNPENCNFSSSFAKKCWAAMELKCPSMIEKNNSEGQSQRVRIIQAQLKELGYYTEYTDNSGNTHLLEMNNINGSRLKEAIINYKSTNGIQPINDNITQTFTDSLNVNAPLPIASDL